MLLSFFLENRHRRRLLQAREGTDQGERPPPRAGGAPCPLCQTARARPSLGQRQVRRCGHQDQGQGRWKDRTDLRHQTGTLKVTRGLLPEM